MTFVQVLISMIAARDWQFYQLSVKNVFLHEDLQKKVYMGLP